MVCRGTGSRRERTFVVETRVTDYHFRIVGTSLNPRDLERLGKLLSSAPVHSEWQEVEPRLERNKP